MNPLKAITDNLKANVSAQTQSFQNLSDKYTPPKVQPQTMQDTSLMSVAPKPIPETIAAPKKTDASAPNVINSQNLAPKGDIKVPPVVNKPTTNNLAMANNTVASGINTQATTPPPVVKTEKTQAEKDRDSLRELRDSITGNIKNQASAVQQINEDEKLQEKKAKAVQIQNELTAMDKAYRDEISAIRKNPEGKLSAGVQNEVNIATDRYNNNRANVSIAYNTALGDYNSALDTVNLKVTSLKDQNAQAIQAYQLNVDAINNDLTESEKLIVQNQLQMKADRARTVEDTYAKALQNAVQNNAPAAVLSAIDEAARQPNATASSILAAAGQYAIDESARLDNEYKRSQIAEKNGGTSSGLRKLTPEDNARLNSTPEAKTINEGSRFANALIDYKRAIEEYGTGDVFATKGKGVLNSTYQTLVGSIKDYYQLGTLDNGVEKLVELGVPKPSIWGIKSSRIASLDTQIDGVLQNLERSAEQLGVTDYANSVEAQNLISNVDKIRQNKLLASMSDEELLSNTPSLTENESNEDFFNKI